MAAIKQIRVRAPARLHMGFLDPNGTSGRRFGSIGVALSGIETEVVVRPASRLEFLGQERARITELFKRLRAIFALPDRVAIEVRKAIPPHIGLGSGTQLRLAVGVAVTRLFGLEVPLRKLATLLGRGLRSGIGIAAFERGGFLVDGGRSRETQMPPLVARLPVPESWRWLLIVDSRKQGLHGERERQAFQRPGFFPPSQVDALMRHLWLGLAALAESEVGPFAEMIDAVQEANGRYFAPVQGGFYTSSAVAEALEWMRRSGFRGLGQSSWGPTGFGLMVSQAEAERVQRDLRERFGDALQFLIVASRNRGAEIEILS